MQELQKERVRQQELIQKQQVPRDLTDYLWNFGLIWSKPHGTGIFDRILYSKVIPFQITIPVAHVTDVEFARSLDMFTDPIVAMPPAGKRAERDAAGPSWSQGRGASDTVRLSTRFFILFG